MNDNVTQEKIEECKLEIKKSLFKQLHMECDSLDYSTDAGNLLEEKLIKYCDNGLPCELSTCKFIEAWYQDFHKSMARTANMFSFYGITNCKKLNKGFEFKLDDLNIAFWEK